MYSLSAEGTLAYIPVRESTAADRALATPAVILVQNWFEELTRRVPVP